MLNQGKTNKGTVINLTNGNKITIWPDTIYSATIRVDQVTADKTICLFQRRNQTAEDLTTAISIGMSNMQTYIFETN